MGWSVSDRRSSLLARAVTEVEDTFVKTVTPKHDIGERTVQTVFRVNKTEQQKTVIKRDRIKKR
jgi:hypothetical protein